MTRIISFFLFLFICQQGSAQSWQWLQRMGSAHVSGSFASPEAPYDICSDPHGNCYVASLVYPTGLVNVDTNMVNTFIANSSNYLLASYSCSGQYRWAKLIGCQAGSTAKAIRSDKRGGIYVLGRMYSQNWSPGQLDDDFMLPASERNLILYKYDTSGNFKWITFPQPDTIGFFNAYDHSTPIDLHVDDDGNCTAFCLLPAGSNMEGQITLNQPEVYALKYNSDGVFQSGTPLPLHIKNLTSFQMSMWFNVLPDGSYVCNGYSFYPGTDSLTIAGIPVRNGFVARFATAGNLLWLHQFHKYDVTFSNAMILGRSASDLEGNIYITGGASHLDTLAGHVFQNPMNPGLNMIPFLMKLNAFGSKVWAQSGEIDYGVVSYAVAQSGNTVAVGGRYPGTLRWQGSPIQLHHVANQGYDSFIALFDAVSGDLITMDSLTGLNGFDEELLCINEAPEGNYFFAGRFPNYLWVPNGALQASGDGDTYFGKFGTDDCIFPDPNSIFDNPADMSLALSPNPALDYFVIQSDEDVIRVQLFDIQGKLIKEFKDNNSRYDIGRLASGLLQVKIITGQGYVTTRKLSIIR